MAISDAALKKACIELKRSIHETDTETARSEARILQLSVERDQLAAELDEVAAACKSVQEHEGEQRLQVRAVCSSACFTPGTREGCLI